MRLMPTLIFALLALGLFVGITLIKSPNSGTGHSVFQVDSERIIGKAHQANPVTFETAFALGLGLIGMSIIAVGFIFWNQEDPHESVLAQYMLMKTQEGLDKQEITDSLHKIGWSEKSVRSAWKKAKRK